MNILLYYILRRFFVDLSFSDNGVTIRKGLFVRRSSTLPLCAVTHTEIKRTLLLRVLGGKQVTLFTLGGSVSFFLRKNEALPFLPEKKGTPLRPKRGAVLLGAFSDTRALGGVVFFSGTLSRIGKIFGSGYYDRIISAIADTAERLSETLNLLHIVVPRITAVIAVFVAAAWLAAFLRELEERLRFSVSASGDYLTVRRGLLTVYEYTLVLNDLSAVISEKTATTSLIGAAPLYARGVMIFPAADSHTADRLAKTLCRIPPAKGTEYRPPLRALFGHCAAPLGWGAAFLGAILLMHIAYRMGMLPRLPVIRSLLWCGAGVCGWLAAAFILYMRGSRLSMGEHTLQISARRGARLRSFLAPKEQVIMYQDNVSLFQRRNGLRDISVCVKQGGRIKLRHAEKLSWATPHNYCRAIAQLVMPIIRFADWHNSIFRQVVQIRRRRAGLSVSPSGTSCHLPHRGRHARQGEFVQYGGKYASKRAAKTIAVNCAVLP